MSLLLPTQKTLTLPSRSQSKYLLVCKAFITTAPLGAFVTFSYECLQCLIHSCTAAFINRPEWPGTCPSPPLDSMSSECEHRPWVLVTSTALSAQLRACHQTGTQKHTPGEWVNLEERTVLIHFPSIPCHIEHRVFNNKYFMNNWVKG